MRELSITTAWNETAAFVKRESALLIPVALAFVALPTAVVQAFAPAVQPGQQPEAGAWMLMILPLVIVTMIGSLALTVLALGRERVVGSALALAARRVWPLIAATFLLGLLAMLVIFPLALVTALLAQTEEGAVTAMMLAGGPILVFLWVRFMLMTPVAAAEPAGPIALLRRSWALTKGQVLKLLGFLLLLSILFLVVTMALTAVLGSLLAIVAGPPEPGSLSFLLLLLLGALLNAAFVLYFAVMVARIYAQLADQRPAS